MSRATQTFANTWGKTRSGSTYWPEIGHQTSPGRSSRRPGEKNMPFWGTSFSAAYVSGVAALVRAKFPELTAYQVINRIVQSAHNPPAGVDNKLGYGLVDPVAALTFNIPSGDRMAPGAQSRVITPAAPPPPPDHRARNIAIGFVGAVATGVLAMAIGARLRRAR